MIPLFAAQFIKTEGYYVQIESSFNRKIEKNVLIAVIIKKKVML